MDKLQLLSFFALGFVISRLLIAVGLPEHLVAKLIGRRPASLTRLSFTILMLAAGLSLFVPNAVTVLTLLPVVEVLRETFRGGGASEEGSDASLATILALAVIYGANIGGLASITATPANGVFVAWLEAKAVAGRDAVQFASWLCWGVPLALIVALGAWGTLALCLRPWRWRPRPVALEGRDEELMVGRRSWAVAVTVLYFLLATGLSLAMLRARGQEVLLVLGVTEGVTLLLVLTLFLLPVGDPAGRRPLLRWADMFGQLPWRGFALIGVAVALGAGLYALKVHQLLASWALALTPEDLGVGTLHVALALLSSFSTEILSNTAVQVGLFVVVGPVAKDLGHSSLRALLTVTLSSTCAFMSPIATGVNGLAFGGVRGVSLWRMLAVGTLVNIVAALTISFWTHSVVWW